MNHWYFPAESGDIRLEATAEGTRLSAVDPTPREKRAIGRLLALGRRRGWVEAHEGWTTGAASLLLRGCSVEAAGRALLGNKPAPPGVLTVLKFLDGQVEASLDGEPAVETPPTEAPALPAPVDKPADTVSTAAGTAELLKKGKALVAKATLPRPTLCCPDPWPGPLDRASEVLQQFCTEAEWAEWTADAMIHVQGGYTGHTYRVVHRHHPLARKQRKIAWDETSDHVVHCHLSNLPPPEEVLSVMMTLKWGEDWIRNPSGWFGPGPRFPHPLGLGASEGVVSAAGFIELGLFSALMSPASR